jgi:1D-myo-inositol-tetrakisphosphate 5-kinase/inositol-polyphosphate multikinase
MPRLDSKLTSLADSLLNLNSLTSPFCSEGTLCDADGELFIKPCHQAEIDFYATANRHYPEFADIMPLFMGNLMLSDSKNLPIDDTVAGVVSDTGVKGKTAMQIANTVAEQVAHATAPLAAEEKAWVPSGGKAVKTDRAVVLENAGHGFKRPNILDVKLGVRLWADDAAQAKKDKFKDVTKHSTHGSLAFRIAGMRVFRGSDNKADWDDEEYLIYDKDYGRIDMKTETIQEGFAKFIFNENAGIDKDLGQAVCAAFAHELSRVEDIVKSHETRIYSASLLFIFEGDGEALREAINKNNEVVSMVEEKHGNDSGNGNGNGNRTTLRADSGIVMGEDDNIIEAQILGDADDDDDDDDDLANVPPIFALKLIDFAHASFVPGKGHDEKMVMGIRNLHEIFDKLSKYDVKDVRIEGLHLDESEF